MDVNSPSLPHRIVIAEKRAKVLHLRRQGHTFAVIANAVGYETAGGAQMAFTQALAELRPPEDDIREMRQVEDLRLDALMVALWPKAMAGFIPAVHAILRVSERRARMWGLDAPVKHTGAFDLSVNTKIPLGFVDDLLREYDAARAASATVITSDEEKAGL